MSFQTSPLDDCCESADAYGRYEGCFLDHRGRPFRFQDHISVIQNTCSPTATQDLTFRSGLEALDLPNPIIDPATFDTSSVSQICSRYDPDQAAETPPKPQGPWFSLLSADQLLPLEVPILKSDPADDLRLYLHDIQEKRSCNMADQWLPLSPTRDAMDEGLLFPEGTYRLQGLLYREIDRECMSTSRGALALVEEAQSLGRSDKLNYSSPALKPVFEPVTPPLSPVSEDEASVFIPDSDICYIDLTSEPMSPPSTWIDNVRNRLLDEKIEPNHTTAEYSLYTPHTPTLLPGYIDSEPGLESLKLEVPAVEGPSSPNTIDVKCLVAEQTAGVQDGSNASDQGNGQIESFFEDALIETLDAHRSIANAAVEQEKYDPIDSFSRVRVPVVDFKLSSLEWEAYGPDPESHFSRIILNSFSSELDPIRRTDISLDSQLQWVPIAHDSAHFRVAEQLATLSAAAQSLLDSESRQVNSSSCYVRQSTGLAILDLGSDDELECDDASEGQSAVSPFFNTVPQLPNEFPATPRSISPGPCITDLVRSKCEGMVLDDAAFSVENCQIVNTEQLLSSFMELRDIKRPKLDPQALRIESTELRVPQQPTPNQESSAIEFSQAAPEMVKEPAPIPKASMPDVKAKYVLSVNLPRSILSYLEEFWSPENLIDRQLSVQSYDGPQTEPSDVMGAPQLSFEADVTLTAGVGIIITSLSKARQRPLPGSDKVPQLRERVIETSRKYERLLVLVSEMNPSGEFVGGLGASDLAAYTEFVQFTIGLEAGVSTFLISGAYETAARWVLAFMCRYSSAALRTSQYLSVAETTWELFFRRAGMNVVAAQVLSSLLYELAGDEGLAHFLNMSAKERLSRYAAILGGEKILLSAGWMLDRPWT